MKKQLALIILLFVISFFAKDSNAQAPAAVKKYIDSALYFMQQRSLYGKKLHWNKIKDSALLLAKDAYTIKGAFPAIAYAFKQLNDHHGMVANEDSFYRPPPPVNFDSILSPEIKKAFLKGPKIVTGFTAGNIAYLRVPSMNVQQQEAIDKKAVQLRDSLCKLLAAAPRGIIIDLRLNGGGNAAPMITGLAPLFKKTLLGYGVDRDGHFLNPVKIKDGVALDENGHPLVNMKTGDCPAANIPIAVLVGPGTASSGEILALFLKQQKNVKLFGNPTAGFCNATEGFLFMEQQGYLLLTVNKIADGKKHICHSMQLRPAITIKGKEDYENIASDAAVAAALKWMGRIR